MKTLSKLLLFVGLSLLFVGCGGGGGGDDEGSNYGYTGSGNSSSSSTGGIDGGLDIGGHKKIAPSVTSTVKNSTSSNNQDSCKKVGLYRGSYSGDDKGEAIAMLLPSDEFLFFARSSNGDAFVGQGEYDYSSFGGNYINIDGSETGSISGSLSITNKISGSWENSGYNGSLNANKYLTSEKRDYESTGFLLHSDGTFAALYDVEVFFGDENSDDRMVGVIKSLDGKQIILTGTFYEDHTFYLSDKDGGAFELKGNIDGDTLKISGKWSMDSLSGYIIGSGCYIK